MTNRAIQLLDKYKKRVNAQLEIFFKKKVAEAGKIDPLAKEAVTMIRDFTLSGGKRIRPAVLFYGYLAAGGKDEDRIVEASMSIELMHSFLLIHDDIIDRDEFRHGTKTLHEAYKAIARDLFPKTDQEHFGNSMAMIAGDMTASMSSEIIFNADFDPATIVRALDRLQRIVYETIPGEMIDVVLEAKGTATEDEIMKMYEGKTSKYTFEGPLHLGGVLAGAEKEMLELFTKYSIPVGCAFQIRDDILGVFGNEKKLGKPVGSDIVEGKQTILVVRAMKNGSKAQKDRLQEILSRRVGVTKEEIGEFRKIILDTKALEEANELSKEMVSEAIEALDKIDFKNSEAEEFLRNTAHYMIERNF